MSYTKLTDFAAKDTLLSGNPSKVVRGTELDAEFNAIATADSLNLKSADASSTYVTKVAEQNSTNITLGSVSGTNTITASASPALTSYSSGQTFRFVSAGANTGAVTVNINSLGAKAITKNGSTALVAGDIPSGAVVQISYDGTQFQLLSGAGSGAATGGGSDQIFWKNGQTVTTDYTIGATENAGSWGPITINTGVTVTVTTGGTWTVA